uniref:Thioredoxin domain-containing protein n=1 Tax=Caulobacter sp. (strain K31) TaxID=366602 RepID=B0SWI4_CAUSK
MPNHKIASREEWLEARKALLVQEKEETKLRDRNAAARMALPWVKVDKTYTFDTPRGRKTQAELFDGRSQLVVYHFMLPPEWEAGCPGCSFLADHLDGALPHLNHHDVTLMAVSRAPLDKIAAYKARMGWKFPWASSFESDFNYDFGVSFTPATVAAGATYNFEPVEGEPDELPGMSSFFKDEADQVFHTYSSYGRGGEELLGTYMILDRAPLGRNEKTEMDWMRRHDEYEDAAPAKACHGEAVPA